ncbi:MAG: hypothetical protein JNJ58_12420 [Chitinophagaceae bacterium]|nr:hypothetical protein [Chitinophagaceae bacterium]
MPYHNIEATLTPTDQQLIFDQLNTIRTKLPFLINLTSKEKRMGRLTHNKPAFRHIALESAQLRPELLPPAQPLEAWAKDENLLTTLQPILQEINLLKEALEDTVLALRMESHSASKNFLNFARISAGTNVPGIDAIVKRMEEALNGKG